MTLFVPELNVLAPTTQPILYRDQYQRRVAWDFPAYANSSPSGRSGYLGLERVGPTGHKYRCARRCSDVNRPISYRAIRRAVEIRCLAKPTALSVGISKPAWTCRTYLEKSSRTRAIYFSHLLPLRQLFLDYSPMALILVRLAR